MPSSIHSTTRSSARQERSYKLTVNTYDRTSTLLIALLVMAGLTVLGLLIIFFANRTFPTIVPIPVVPVEATSANANQGFATEPDPPGAEEAPDLAEPQLQDTLDALTSAASTSQALLSDETLDAEKEAGKGKGLGDARMAGPGGDGVVERVPRWERWKFRFEPESTGEFARWLDFHKIEIGVLGRSDNLIHYASELSTGNPKQRAGKPTEETRGRTSPADGPMPALLNRLARKADISRHGSIILLFYPFEVESILWTIEQKHAEGRGANAIRETVFTVTRDGGNFSFEVIDQKYF